MKTMEPLAGDTAGGTGKTPPHNWFGWLRRPSFWFILPAALVLLTVYAGPMLFALRASFTGWILVEPGSDQDFVGLENYISIIQSPEYQRAVVVTLVYAFLCVLGGLVLGMAFAHLLMLDFFGRSFFRSIMMIPMVLTPSVIGIFWRLFYDERHGMFNWLLSSVGLPMVSWLGLSHALMSIIIMDIWQTTPFFMLILYAGLQALDENQLAAAKVDGASALQLFRYIILPHLVPYMLIAASFRAIAALGDFDKIYLLTSGGPGDVTTTMSIYAYKIGFSAFDMGRTTAIAWLFVLIVLAVSAPLLRFLFKSAVAHRT